MAKRLVRAALVGLAVGVLVLGAGGRAAMRLVALMTRQTPHFGLEGSLGILVIGAVLGTATGILYGLVFQQRWPGRTTLKGLAVGTLLFAVLTLTQPPAIRTEVAAARALLWAIVPLFWALCVIHAILLAHRLPTRASQEVSE